MLKKCFKKLAVFATVCMMTMSLAGCGDTDKNTTEDTTEVTTEETTTELTTEETTEEATEEDAEIATAGDAPQIDLDEDGILTLSDMKIKIPDNYEYSADDSAEGSATFVDYNSAAVLVIAVDNQNSYFNDENVVDAFDTQIKAPYGDAVTHSDVTYNGHAGTEWVLDNEEGGYVGRSLVICDGTMMIYIEYVSYAGSVDAYEEAVKTIEY